MKRTPLYILCLLLAMCTEGFAAANLQQADSAYKARNYYQAAALYEAALKQQPTADTYYNYGNALWRVKDTAQAILAYHRALALSPEHEDARFNLQFCQQQLAQPTAAGEMFFISLFRRWMQSHSALHFAGWACICFACFFVGLVLYRHTERRWMAYAGKAVMIVALLLTITLNILAVWNHYATANDRRAVVMQATPLYKAPNASESPVRTLAAGTTVTIEESQLGGWCQVSLPDGRAGWITDKALQTIRVGVATQELDL